MPKRGDRIRLLRYFHGRKPGDRGSIVAMLDKPSPVNGFIGKLRLKGIQPLYFSKKDVGDLFEIVPSDEAQAAVKKAEDWVDARRAEGWTQRDFANGLKRFLQTGEALDSDTYRLVNALHETPAPAAPPVKPATKPLIKPKPGQAPARPGTRPWRVPRIKPNTTPRPKAKSDCDE